MNVRNYQVAVGVFVVIALTGAAVVLLAGPDSQYLAFDSDALVDLAMLGDILHGRIGWWDWQQALPVPFVFPDGLLAAVVYGFTSRPAVFLFVFALLQVALTWLAARYLTTGVLRNHAALVAAFFIVAVVWLTRNWDTPYRYMYVLRNHWGSIVVGLFYAGIWVRLESSRQPLRLGVVALVVAYATAYSDPLFLVWAVLPAIGATILARVILWEAPRRSVVIVALASLPSLLIPKIYKVYVSKSPHVPLAPSLSHAPARLKEVSAYLGRTATELPLTVAVQIAVLILAGVLVFRILVTRRKETLGGIRAGADSTETYAILWLASFAVASLFVFYVIQVIVPGQDLWARYFSFVDTLPILVSAGIACYLWGRVGPRSLAAIGALACVGLAWGSARRIREFGVRTEYYPDDIACIDNVLRDTDMRSGVAEFWSARRLQSFTHLGLRLAQLRPGNPNFYGHLMPPQYFVPPFDFALDVTSNAPPFFYRYADGAIQAWFGNPRALAACPYNRVYLYGKGRLYPPR